MNFWDYQSKKLKAGKPAEPTVEIPEIKLDELEAPPAPIEVEESTPSDTFIGRIRADILKRWGKE